MSALALLANSLAVAPGISTSFGATGGTSPYTFSVVGGGAGGTINSSTGMYTAPSIQGETAATFYDTVRVTDHVGAIADLQILVGLPILLLCDVIQQGLGLSNGRVWLWDQKIMEPTDSNLYCVLRIPSCKPFGSSNSIEPSTGNQIQQCNMLAKVDISIKSRGPAARDQKENVILALNSVYSKQQQQLNNFYISKIPSTFVDLSGQDGAAVPYRFVISVNMQYLYTMNQAAPYFNTFGTPTVKTEP